jgi:uroporphyrinogen decarboxylase
LNSRERLANALNHHEPDRVPIDLGSIVTGITTAANDEVKKYLGLESDDPVVDRIQQLAQPSEALLRRLRVDTRYLMLKPPHNWMDLELDDQTYEDEFGVQRRAAVNTDGRLLYYDFVSHPLSNVESVADLAKYDWPDPRDPARFEGLESLAREMYERTEYGLIVNAGGGIFEPSWYLRGFMRFLEDLLTDPPLADALMDAMMEYQLALFEEILSRVGPYVSVVFTGSDLGTQRAPLISPQLYRDLIRPRDMKFCELVRMKTDAKIFYHSCGSIYPMIPYLIEAGIDILHPVQPLAAEMGDRKRLKREFGDRLVFWGGFDQQHVLPFGTPEEVRQEARKLLDDFMPGGGFVFAAGHNIQYKVPPENVLTLFDTVYDYGRY